MLAKDLMTAPAVSVTHDTSVHKAIRLMLEKNVSGLPVIDDSGTLCGMLTEGDLLKKSTFNVGSRQPPEHADRSFFEDYVRAHGTVVSDCMTAEVASVAPEATLPVLVSMMRTKNVRRVPVVDRGKLVGVVSRHDVLRAITSARDMVAGGEDALRLAVTTRLHEELGLKPDEVSVRIRGAIVELAEPGKEPARRRAMQLVAENVSGVAGVVFRSAETG